MRVMAFDPGGTTGYAFTIYPSYHKPVLSWGQIPQASVWDVLHNFAPEKLIVERFVYRRLPKIDLEAVEVIGILKEWHRQTSGVTIHWQSSSQIKTPHYTAAKLKEREVYEAGKPHAMDAIRHLLYWQDFVVRKLRGEGAKD